MGTHIANRFKNSQDISKYNVTSVAEVALFGASTTKEVILFLDNFFENANIYNAYGKLFINQVFNNEKLRNFQY